MGESGPDVYSIDAIWPGMFADQLVDLSPYFQTRALSSDPGVVEDFKIGGRLVAVPYRAAVGVLYYRVNLLHKYGYAHPPRTWEELETMALHIQQGERASGKKDFWGFAWPGAAAEGLLCNALEWQKSEGGGQIIETDKTISVNNPAAIHSWERARGWVGRISPSRYFVLQGVGRNQCVRKYRKSGFSSKLDLGLYIASSRLWDHSSVRGDHEPSWEQRLTSRNVGRIRVGYLQVFKTSLRGDSTDTISTTEGWTSSRCQFKLS